MAAMTAAHTELKKGDVILQVRNLVKHFPVRLGLIQALRTKVPPVLKAVDNVSFDVYKGEIFGVVGESGCGKTTLARTILRLTDATSGSAILEGTDIMSLSPPEMKKLRKKMQVIFQDPLRVHEPSDGRADDNLRAPEDTGDRAQRSRARDIVARVLADVEMLPPEEYDQCHTSCQAASVSASPWPGSRWIPISSWRTSQCPCWTCPSGEGPQPHAGAVKVEGVTFIYITHDLAPGTYATGSP